MHKLLPIIDIHQHAFTADFEKDRTPVKNPKTGDPSTASTDHAMITETIKQMDKHNIEKALTGGNSKIINNWLKTAPDRFIPSIELRGNPITPPVKQVKELLQNDLIKAVGEILTQYSGISPDDPKLFPYYALAEEYDVPAWIHVSGTGAFVPTFRVRYGNPLLIEEVLEKFPDIRLSICHSGYPFKAEMISMLYMYPRLYADISVLNWLRTRETFYDYLSEVLENSGAHKQLMFGSDQMWWPEVIDWAVDSVQSAPFLSKKQKRDIFYNNAKRFLKI